MLYCIKSVVPRRKLNALGAMGLISTVFNAGMQDYQNRKNRDAQEYMLREAQAFQRELNANSTLTQKQSLQRAGLPVSLMTGPGDYSASTVLGDSSSQHAPTIDSSIFMQAAKQKQDQPMIDAQSRLMNAQADKQEIENRRMMSEDAQYSVEDALAYFEDHPNSPLPEVEVVPKNRGWFDAKRNYNLLRGEEGDTLVKRVDGFIKNAQYIAEDVRNSIIKLPISVRQKVIAEASLSVAKSSEVKANKAYIDAQTSYTKLKEQLERDNNIMPYIDKIFMGDFGFDDFCKLLVLGVIAARR